MRAVSATRRLLCANLAAALQMEVTPYIENLELLMKQNDLTERTLTGYHHILHSVLPEHAVTLLTARVIEVRPTTRT